MIRKGDKLPDGEIWELAGDEGSKGPKQQSVNKLCAGKKIIVFGLPGAFTPTCSDNHLPGFVKLANDLLQKADEIWCISVNDAFVMDAWGKQNQVRGKIKMLADGNCLYAGKLGLTTDFTSKGMGVRMRRFSMFVSSGIVDQLNVESPGEFSVSSAEILLSQLK